MYEYFSGEEVDDIPGMKKLDVRCFWDPSCGELKYHDGRHPEIIRRFIRNEWFVKLARVLQSTLEALETGEDADSDGNYQIVLFCKAGQHRSVAGGLVLEHIVKNWFPSLQLHEVQNCSIRKCSCESCSGSDGDRNAAFDEASQVWCQAVQL